MFHGTSSKVSKFAPEEDVISSMPDSVITNILDRLPIQYAVRTDVLSKNWRLKWTLLTQLVFDKNFFKSLRQPCDPHRNNPDEPYKYNGSDISRLLLHLKGPITKFVLYIPYDYGHLIDVKDFSHWVLYLSRKGIKDFTFIDEHNNAKLFKVPTHLFSCTELKHLKLKSCHLGLSPTFTGFPKLVSLELYHVIFKGYICGEFLARCPLLEILKISLCGPIREPELNEIAKLVKLKILNLDLLIIDNLTVMALEKSFAGKFPIACLKTLTLSNVRFDCDINISFVFKMICGSPNLKTLDITATYWSDNIPPPELFSPNQSMGQLQLQSVMFGGFRGSETEVCLIEFLFARSPLLKKISIGLGSSYKMVGGADGKFIFANKLLKLYRASPVVEIDLY